MAGRTEARIIPFISGTVAIISSFMQNVGAAALFLPVVSRISARSGLSLSRLLMPMGFCAILGGTVTMVGSSPLILLNDLILTSNQALSAEQKMNPFGLFSVTPIGLALVSAGIIYFVLLGRMVLPAGNPESSTVGSNTMSYFQDVYGIDYALFEVKVPARSPLVGKLFDDIEGVSHIRIIATMRTDNGHPHRSGRAGARPGYRKRHGAGYSCLPCQRGELCPGIRTREQQEPGIPSVSRWPRPSRVSPRWLYPPDRT